MREFLQTNAREARLAPPFPRETWFAEVTKMHKTFSGSIPDKKVVEIVDYLVAVRGADPK